MKALQILSLKYFTHKRLYTTHTFFLFLVVLNTCCVLGQNNTELLTLSLFKWRLVLLVCLIHYILFKCNSKREISPPFHPQLLVPFCSLLCLKLITKQSSLHLYYPDITNTTVLSQHCRLELYFVFLRSRHLCS